MPPTDDAFEQHVLWAQCQVAMWSHVVKPEKMNPGGHCWHVNAKDELCPTMYQNESAPAEVRDITHVYCTYKCGRRQKCQCVIAGLEGTDIFSCGGECENQREMSEAANGDDTDMV